MIWHQALVVEAHFYASLLDDRVTLFGDNNDLDEGVKWRGPFTQALLQFLLQAVSEGLTPVSILDG